MADLFVWAGAKGRTRCKITTVAGEPASATIRRRAPTSLLGPKLLKFCDASTSTVSTEGDKTKVGGLVHCIYEGGDLVKRITNLEPPVLMEFEVVEPHLGVGDCVATTDGSYAILPTTGC
jgi:hypothetical protein